ncbi:MAG: hypothetical protein SGBAC_007804 [Bacillariaceae sp.]
MEIEDDDELDQLVALMATLPLSSDDHDNKADTDIIKDDDDEEPIELDLEIEFATSMNDLVELMSHLSTSDSKMDDNAEIDCMVDDKDKEMELNQPEIDWMQVDGCWTMAAGGGP